MILIKTKTDSSNTYETNLFTWCNISVVI